MPIDSRLIPVLSKLGIGQDSLISEREQEGIATRFIAMAQREQQQRKLEEAQAQREAALAEQRSGGITRARGFYKGFDRQDALKTLISLGTLNSNDENVLRAFLQATEG